MLLFGRALSEEESKKVRAYLDAKHAHLKQNLPPDGPGNGVMLESVADPPAVNPGNSHSTSPTSTT